MIQQLTVGLSQKSEMPILFEYGEWKTVSDAKALKQSLLNVWDKRFFVDAEIEQSEEVNDKNYQPFLKFDGNQIRANNFVGFIQNDDNVIEIYPKVCKPRQFHALLF